MITSSEESDMDDVGLDESLPFLARNEENGVEQNFKVCREWNIFFYLIAWWQFDTYF